MVPIVAVLDGAVRAARAELPEVAITLELIQGELPGLEEDASPELEPEPEAPAGEAEEGSEVEAPDPRTEERVRRGGGTLRHVPGKKRRPKGSSPVPKT